MGLSASAGRSGNRILDRLPPREAEPLLSAATPALFSHGQEVYRAGRPIVHVYFPTTAVLGVVMPMEDGRLVEGTAIGNEGMAGLPVFLGANFHPFRVVAQVPGDALQLPADRLVRAAGPGSMLDRLLRLYSLYRLRAANQMGACNSLHSVAERMCRWLLTAHDGAGNKELPLTHEFLAELLGVRRQTVSITARALQSAGLIAYRRGALRVVNREGLEDASCECYAVLKQLYERIMGG